MLAAAGMNFKRMMNIYKKNTLLFLGCLLSFVANLISPQKNFKTPCVFPF